MAGLELLYKSSSGSISRPQDALVCFVHWEFVQRGYKCLGTGDEPKDGEKKSELLPDGWNACGEVYTLRYRSNDDRSSLLLKGITVDSTMIFNLMESSTGNVTDLTVSVSDYVDEANLQTFESVFKNTKDLTKKLKSSLIPEVKGQSKVSTEKRGEASASGKRDPLRSPTRRPPTSPHSIPDPLDPFACGSADLDPLSGRPGGMIVDPLHSGVPGFDPSRGIPPGFPEGFVPPRPRIYPRRPHPDYGTRSDPDPDHLRPPDFEDSPDLMDPFACGGADLDPFSARPGGMLMDPLHSGVPGFDPSRGIPPGFRGGGFVPPGARIYPRRPHQDYGSGSEPDPDHMRPPDFGDRFM